MAKDSERYLTQADLESGGSFALDLENLTNAQAYYIRETTGPTKLTVGNITDGDFVKRSGATIISGTVDISDNTNLAAGAPITLTGDSVGLNYSATDFKVVGGELQLLAGGGATTAEYVTLALDASLSAERVLTGTANQIVITDNGANSTVVLSTPQNIHTAATPAFAGLTIAGTVTPTILFQSTDASDPTMTWQTTNTAHQINIILDESAVNDRLCIQGQTASVATHLCLHSQDGQSMSIQLYSGGTNHGDLIMGAADNLSLRNAVQDKNIVLTVNVGGGDQTITFVGATGYLTHSSGTFNFDNENLTTTGTISGVNVTSGTDPGHTHSAYVGPHAILDGTVHTDSVARNVTRGSLVYGNSTPAWDELVISTGFLGGDGTDASWRSYANTLADLSGEAGATFDFNSQLVTGVSNAIDLSDAVNLDILLDHVGVSLKYYLGNQTLDLIVTDAEAALQETPNADPDELTTITFKSTVADTPAPFMITAGTELEVHFDADETSGAGRNEGLHCVFGYVDANGTSNFTQIGSDSDVTAALTTTKTSYAVHIHVTSDITVPAGKRLWLKYVATTVSGAGGYPELNVYYDKSGHHMNILVAGSVLGDFIKKSIFDAHTVLYATTNDTPVTLTLNEQTVVGRLTGGDISAITLGIADNNLVQIDDAGPAADNEYCKFTASGVDGQAYVDVLGDLSGQAGAAFSWNSQNLTSVGTIGCGTITVVDGSSINLQEDITFTGATTENIIAFPDALAVALAFKEGANSYMTFVTTNSAEEILLGVDLDMGDNNLTAVKDIKANDGTLNIVLASAGTVYIKGTTEGGEATGGTITYDGAYAIHTFTEDGNFESAGTFDVEYLVVAGGGGGGGDGNTTAGGGAGAGGYRTNGAYDHEVTAQVYAITVGDGGAGGAGANTENGANGEDSVFDTITSDGGGGGSGIQSGAGVAGGSGGGGNYGSAGGAGTGGQGNAGGSGHVGNPNRGGGGGGGATAVGGNGTSTAGGGGGIGTESSITGAPVTRGGGGGGGTFGSGGTEGSGGDGGGGDGGNAGGRNPGDPGTVNTGGGGGGASTTTTGTVAGGNGGSGVVIIRYLTSTFTAAHLNVQNNLDVGAIATVPNTGLHILDTDASHDLIIKPGSDLGADRTLTVTTGDADRTLTLSGNPTLGDWFDQAVKQASNVTFGTIDCEAVTSSGASTFNSGSVDADFTVNWNTGIGLFVEGSSGNVGRGTSSPQRDLHIEGGVPTIRLSDSNAATDQAVATLIEFYRGNNTNRVGFLGMESSSNNNLRIATDYAAGQIQLGTGNSVTALTIDSSQRVGIGTIPKNWDPTTVSVLQMFSGENALIGAGGSIQLCQNAYWDDVSNRWEYVTADFASRYNQAGGGHFFEVATAGANPDDPISWITGMSIDNAGNIGCGAITSTGAIQGELLGASGSIDVVQGSDINIITNDTLVLTFAFVPTKIDLRFSGTTIHDTSFEYGHTTGNCLVTITGTDTLTVVMNATTFYNNNGGMDTARIQNDTTNTVKLTGGYDGADQCTIVGVGTWDTGNKQLTITFTAANAHATLNFAELMAVAYR